jgi:hypothetical protein
MRSRLVMIVAVMVAVAVLAYTIIRFGPSASSPTVAHAFLPTGSASYPRSFQDR